MGARRLTLLLSLVMLTVAPSTAGTADTVLTAADGRKVPVRISWPDGGGGRLPLLILSHGANGTLDGLGPLQRGLTRDRIVAAPRHLDSEANPDLAKVDRAQLFGQRVADMTLLLDSLPVIEQLSGRRIDTRKIAAGGHSFGALIAQALGGARVGAPARDRRDARIVRVVAFSPPGPLPGYAEPGGWAAMAVPQLVTTGTADLVPMMAPQWQLHMASFEAATVRGSWLWVGHGVDHYFGNKVQRLTRSAPDQSAGFDRALDLADAFLRGKPLRGGADAVTERLVRK